MRLSSILIASTMLAFAAPATAQDAGSVPAFRVPIGGESSSSSGPAVYAWMQNVGTCSNTCGNGTRATTYQCQDANSYDFGGAGYGAPEADSLCSAAGAKPATSSVSCTNFSGCSYDWVKPAVATDILAKPNPPGADYPKGAVAGCSYAKRVYSPFCQRLGDDKVQLPAGDHPFCRSDTPDYDDVTSGNPDALGYDRTSEITTACKPGDRDYGWKTGDWKVAAAKAPATDTCTNQRDQSRTVECTLKFNGTVVGAENCTGIAKPETTGRADADYTSCSYNWESGTFSAWSSGCSTSATRMRSVTCRRSDGEIVGDDKCGGGRPAATETGSNLVDCGYEWTTPTEWKYASNCSGNTTRSRTTTCRRSDGVIVADSQCLPSTKPPVYEAGVSDYSVCTYAPRDMGKSECASSQQNQYWDCTRADGTVGFPASYCGKTNPEVVGCTMPPPVYTYTPVNRGESTCANSQKQVYWDCTRNDGVTGFPAANCGKTNPTTEGCQMVYTYNWAAGGWSGYNSNCSANATRSRAVSCVRNDGYVDSDQYCNAAARPASQESTGVYSGCGYQTEATSGYTACGSNGQQTRSVQCRRSDGTIVDNSLCGTGPRQTQACTYSPPAAGSSQYCSGGTAVASYQDSGDWSTDSGHAQQCRNLSGNCLERRYDHTVEQSGQEYSNTTVTCFKNATVAAVPAGSGAINVRGQTLTNGAYGWCSYGTGGGQGQEAQSSCLRGADAIRVPEWEYVYSAVCEGGQEIANGGSFWSGGYQSPYGPNAPEKGLTTVDQCQALGGNCFQKYTAEHSEYGSYETRTIGYRCFKGSTDAHYDPNYYYWDNYGYAVEEAAIYR